MARTIRLGDDEARVLDLALELYVRLGLGQAGEIAQRLDLIQGHRLARERMARVRQLAGEMEELAWDGGLPWSLKDKGTSLYTLTAYRLGTRLVGNMKEARWADRQIKESRAADSLDPREL